MQALARAGIAFRELGLSIGLRAARRMRALVEQNPDAFARTPSLDTRLDQALRHAPLIGTIEGFWLDPAKGRGRTWRQQKDINAVMLATSLALAAVSAFDPRAIALPGAVFSALRRNILAPARGPCAAHGRWPAELDHYPRSLHAARVAPRGPS